MSIEDVALKRDDSDIIQFDNIFSNDLAREQQLDLLFGAKEDEDIIDMIEYRLFTADGEERVFAEIDEETLLKEDEEEDTEVDISNNDSNGNNVDDDMEEKEGEEGEKEDASAKIEIEIDADNVNISPDSAVKEDGDVNVTAQVVNITPNASDAAMSGEDLSTAMTKADDSTATPEEIPAPVTPDDNEPAADADQTPVNGAENVVGEDFDTTRPEPAVSDDEEASDLPVDEDVQELNTASDLEDALNAGLEPAPAPEETSPTAEPEDPSTEVVFGDSNDIEEKCDPCGESADGAVRPEDDTVVGTDDGNITHGDAPEEANNGIPETEQPAHKDTAETQVGFLPRTVEELDAAMDTVEDLDIAKEAKEPEDPNEEAVENDAETSLLGIEPTLTAGDLDKIFNNAEEDPNKDGKFSPDLNEAAEPSKGNDEAVKEAVEPVKEECCDSEPKEDEGPQNIDNGIKVPETVDDLAKEFDTMDSKGAEAEEAEKETISGEEDAHSKADGEWEDAVAKSDITADDKLADAKEETGYKDNRDAGDNDTSDELNESPDTIDDLGELLGDVEAEAEPDPTDGEAPNEGCGSEACGSGSEACGTENCKEECEGICDSPEADNSNKSDDKITPEEFSTEVKDPKNDGDDEPIVDDKEQAGEDKQDGGAINTADANPTMPPATAPALEAAFAEIAADSTEVIPDEVELPKEDGEYDETVKKDKVSAPGNDGNDVEVCIAAESVEELDKLFEDFEDQVEGISDDEVFDAEINTGLETSPEEDEPGSIEDEIEDEAIDIVEAMK